MPDVSTAGFVEQLLRGSPVVRGVVEEHVSAWDELLIHVLMGELLRCATNAFHSSDVRIADEILALADWALREGDDELRNAVCVSFVEHAGQGAGETAEFLDSWPAALAAERERQARWRPA